MEGRGGGAEISGPAQTGSAQEGGSLERIVEEAARAAAAVEAEGKESTRELAHILGDIEHSQAAAEIEGRVVSVEHQLERLAARRRDVEGRLENEIAVMRAGLQDALRSLDAIGEEHKTIWRELEGRLFEALEAAERRAVTDLHTTRLSSTRSNEELSMSLEQSQARIKGELDVHAASLSQQLSSYESSVSELVGRLEEDLARRSELEGGSIRNDVHKVQEQFANQLQGGLRQVEEIRVYVATQLGVLREEAEKVLREALGRVVERMHSLGVEVARTAAEATALASDRAVEVDNAIRQSSDLAMHLGSLAARVAGLEARTPVDHRAVDSMIAGLSARLEGSAQTARQALERSGGFESRIEGLSTDVTALRSIFVNTETRLGSMQYLDRRLEELAQRVGELARETGKAHLSATPGSTPLDEVVRRLESLERRFAPNPPSRSSLPERWGEKV